MYRNDLLQEAPDNLVLGQVIADITRRMGEGMAEFIEKEVLTVKDYDLYCHYVAGLVGIGLSQVLISCLIAQANIIYSGRRVIVLLALDSDPHSDRFTKHLCLSCA